MGMSETNLLFGILSRRLRVATVEQLQAATAAWAEDPESDLGEILVEQGVITPRQREAIAGFVSAQVSEQSGDASRAYAAQPATHSAPHFKWRYNTRYSIKSSPALGDSAVFVDSSDGTLYAINLDGSLRWNYKSGGEVYSSRRWALMGRFISAALTRACTRWARMAA